MGAERREAAPGRRDERRGGCVLGLAPKVTAGEEVTEIRKSQTFPMASLPLPCIPFTLWYPVHLPPPAPRLAAPYPGMEGSVLVLLCLGRAVGASLSPLSPPHPLPRVVATAGPDTRLSHPSLKSCVLYGEYVGPKEK